MLRKKTTFLVLGFASVAASTGLHAQEAGTGLYLYGALASSGAKFDQSQLDTNLRSAGASGVASTLDARYMGQKFQVGYMFDRTTGIEGGWVDLGKFHYNAAITGGSINTEIRASGFNLGLVHTYPIDADFSFFATLGLLYADTRIKALNATGIALNALDKTDKGWSPDLGVGFNIAISPKAAVRIGYERFFRVGTRNTTARPDIDFFSAGVKYSFR